MKTVRVGAAVLNQTPLDWDQNLANILGAIEQARSEDVSLLSMPEMCISGYGCEDAFHAPHVYEMSWELLRDEIRPRTTDMIVSVGLPIRYNNGFYNAACLIADEQILGFVCKQYLAGDGIHYEPRWFKPWPADVTAFLRRDGTRYPIGDIYFEVGGIRIGFEICEDAWVAHRPGSELSRKAVDVILNPSASHFAFDKLRIRRGFVLEGSRAFGVTYIYSNLLGNEAGRAIYDGGAMIAASGSLVAAGPRFSYAPFHVTSATIDVERTRVDRARMVSHRPLIDPGGDDCILVDFDFPEISPDANEVHIAPWEDSETIKEEEFTRAISLALFDYLRKSRSRGFVVSLSGGADSAAVATLIGLSVWLGVKDLGLSEFKKRLEYIDGIPDARSPDEIVGVLLTTAYQATRNSSETTSNAARTVAEALHAEFYHLDVDDIVQSYTTLIERAIGRELTWETDDIALQNIQARTRAPSIWMLANLTGKLLVATSNRSEAAVGYATMDGDTAGGLSPIAGIDKAFLRQWLRWMEEEGPMGHPAFEALHVINAQQPTAELRPPDQHQTDEGDLMPYPVLDAIERAFIRDKRSPAETLELMHVRFPRYDDAQLRVWVERFFVLWCRNQWKRERYAPSFHVDDENLDPKTWCRFPILSGGYRRELAALRDSDEQE
jgi:NAD+ synthase (glutamine-hydrolysing)